jgi:NitT/TauT family transport system permease protein
VADPLSSMAAPRLGVGEDGARWTRLVRQGVSGQTGLTVAALVVFAIVWEIGSFISPAYAIPSWGRILAALVTLSPYDVGITVARVVGSMAASFLLGLGFSLLVFDRPRLEAFLVPYVRLLMAVPAVCWVVFSILWFRGVEFRIFFVMFISCAPVFAVDSLDAMKSVPNELRQMVNSFRPDPIQRFTKIILPGIVPNLLTSWKVNFTLAIRIVTIAELVGAMSGIGHGLELAQELFSVPVVFAWTLVLVAILFAFEFSIAAIERRALRWRNA